MKEDEFRAWCVSRKLKASSVATVVGRVKRIEAAYGSLDDRYDKLLFDALIEDFTYSAEDERAGRPNDTKIEFTGRLRLGYADMKKTLRRYRDFSDQRVTN